MGPADPAFTVSEAMWHAAMALDDKAAAVIDEPGTRFDAAAQGTVGYHEAGAPPHRRARS